MLLTTKLNLNPFWPTVTALQIRNSAKATLDQLFTNDMLYISVSFALDVCINSSFFYIFVLFKTPRLLLDPFVCDNQ
jgi:hypothetical protein